jgi:2-dehydro-3-deoxygluconokinase
MLKLGFGIPGPDVERKSRLDPNNFIGMIDQVVDLYPHVKIVASTLREAHLTSHHSWKAVAWIDGQTYLSPTAELKVNDCVGGEFQMTIGFK